MNTPEFVDGLLIYRPKVELSVECRHVVLDAEPFYEDGREYHRHVGYTLTTCMGGRRVCSIRYGRLAAQAILDSDLFDTPTEIFLNAHRGYGRDRGLLYVAFGAAPGDIERMARLMDLDRSVPGGLGLWTLPDGDPGLLLGEWWLPAGPDVLEKVPFGFDAEERLAAFAEKCKPFFDRVLYGDPKEEVERLLEEVPAGPGDR